MALLIGASLIVLVLALTFGAGMETLGGWRIGAIIAGSVAAVYAALYFVSRW